MAQLLKSKEEQISKNVENILILQNITRIHTEQQANFKIFVDECSKNHIFQILNMLKHFPDLTNRLNLISEIKEKTYS